MCATDRGQCGAPPDALAINRRVLTDSVTTLPRLLASPSWRGLFFARPAACAAPGAVGLRMGGCPLQPNNYYRFSCHGGGPASVGMPAHGPARPAGARLGGGPLYPCGGAFLLPPAALSYLAPHPPLVATAFVGMARVLADHIDPDHCTAPVADRQVPRGCLVSIDHDQPQFGRI